MVGVWNKHPKTRERGTENPDHSNTALRFFPTLVTPKPDHISDSLRVFKK